MQQKTNTTLNFILLLAFISGLLTPMQPARAQSTAEPSPLLGLTSPSNGRVYTAPASIALAAAPDAATTPTTTTLASNLFTLTVNNGSGSGSYTAGTIVNISANPSPAGQVFLKWSSTKVANVTARNTTLTMPATNTSVTATYGPDQIVPQPVASHPRLWITANDLPRLRSWATASNPLYANGFQPALTYAIDHTNDHWNWQTGLPGPGWQDTGSALFPADVTEAYAEFFAFASLIDPNPANRDLYAQRARTLLMYVMNQAVQGAAAGQPFRDPQFATYDRSRTWGEGFGLTVDWIYPYLSTQDKATIRQVFLRWAEEQLTAYNHPLPLDVTNSPLLLGGAKGPRWAANNYFSGHMRHLVLMSLSFDPADDPAINPALSSLTLGNTLRSYLLNVTGAWLYEQYAIYEDANIVAPTYHVPTSGLGIASGGLSVEGSMYGDSLAYVQEALLALHTAGFHNETLAGPQIKLIDSTYWDKLLDGFLHSLTPMAQVDPTQSYLGPIYQMASHGDMLRFWISPHDFPVYGALGVYDYLAGNTQRLAKARWIAANAMQGGIEKLAERAGGNIWGNADATHAILYFLMFDPAVTAQSIPDPRPTLPTTFHMPAIGRILSRTDWSAEASWFTYKCGWLSINHQNGDCNQFEFYRKGEWLTKERSGYANDSILMTSDYHNTLALQNTVTSGTTQPNLQFYETETWLRGGQWTNDANAGDPTVLTSFGNDYIATTGISTNLYNRPDQWTPANGIVDILHASRSLVWLKPDTIVVYDRGTSKTANRFKRFNLVLTGNTTINGKLATEVTPKGQQLFIHNLLPANATLTVSPAENFNLVAQGEPSQFRLVVEDPSNPSDVRFLHVLEGADAGMTPTPVQLLRSISGAAFEGAITGHTAVLFRVNLSTAGGATYQVPLAVTNHLVTGLTPGGKYNVTALLTDSTAQITVTPNGTMYTADSGGVLNFDTDTLRTVTIKLDTVPDNVANFRFTTTFGNFYLDDMAPQDADAYSNSQSFAVSPQDQTVTVAATPNWALAAITCTPSNAAVVSLATNTVTLINGADVACTFTEQRKANILVRTYNDLNGSGTKNSNEPLLPGWMITVNSSLLLAPLQLVTNDLGKADFTLLAPGSYTVCQVMQAGWLNTQPGGATPCRTITLQPGVNTTVYFGNRQSGATAATAPASIDEIFATLAPDDTTVEDAELVDTSAWVQADLATPDSYFTDVGATEPTGVALNNKLYLPLIQQ